MAALEYWASPEVTVARIDAGTWRDQVRETGHHDRDDDIERIAALGVSAARYPVLWERVAPHGLEHADFSWEDRRLRSLLAAGVEPIVTLLHHGSGPVSTSLVDADFPQKFAAYAGLVARRYPFVRRWTPVNEPTTTARFSTLYAAWYPNGDFDHGAFGRAMVNQALGAILAMRAIREVRPDAEFVVTDDLQRFHAGDDAIAGYAQHKRERSFLGVELVAGRVRPGHALWSYLTDTARVPRALLDRIAGEPCVPNLVGWNYYPNSERFLASLPGGRHRNEPLVDVAPELLDAGALLTSAWERLRLPMGFAEVHVYGAEDERACWLVQRHADLLAARDAGADVRAFGAWAAFGMVDWMSLLCRRERRSEDGLYTFAGNDGTPRPTAAARALAALAAGTDPQLADVRGWWERKRPSAA